MTHSEKTRELRQLISSFCLWAGTHTSDILVIFGGQLLRDYSCIKTECYVIFKKLSSRFITFMAQQRVAGARFLFRAFKFLFMLSLFFALRN